MKKIIGWIKSPASDFALFVLLLALANIAGQRLFLRFDLTEQKSYSISEASRQTVSTLSEPLSVKVFFSDNLPSPYNAVAQYVRDILVEYKGAANRNFNYTFFDMKRPENGRIAQDFGLRQVQIQEVKNNGIGFKQAWMGLAVSYGDAIETMDGITSDSGFEYNLTTKIAGMVSKADALSGLGGDGAIAMTLYATDALGGFRIGGFNELDSAVQAAFYGVNKKNMNRMAYQRKNPSDAEAELLAEKYGLQIFNWTNKDGSDGVGVFGLVLEYGGAFRTIPLSIQRSIFGYVVSGLDALDSGISESLRSLLAKSVQVGYVAGHSETALSDEGGADMNFTSMLSDMYELREINLAEEDVPAGISALIINGPKTAFLKSELYKIDQFLMRGGSLMLFIDPFEEKAGGSYQTEYAPIDTGLDSILNSYGIALEKNYVFDENCYTAQQQGYGEIKMYWAPMMQKRQLSQRNPISKNLGYVIFLNAGAIDVSAAEADGALSVTALAKSSAESWTESRNIQLNPMTAQPPYDKSVEKSENLAVLVEGKFKSAFEKNPSDEGAADGGAEFSASSHISSGIQRGRIFAAGTSFITGNQLIDKDGSEPVALFVRNAVDYMNGSADLCTMRTKGLSLNTLSNTGGSLALAVKYFNQFGLAALVALSGLLVWRLRVVRRNAIRGVYNPSDSREIKS